MSMLIVTNILSVDGYYEGPGANAMALPMDHRFDAYNANGSAMAQDGAVELRGERVLLRAGTRRAG